MNEYILAILKNPNLDPERIIGLWNVYKNSRPLEEAAFHWTWDFISYYSTYRCLLINNFKIHPLKNKSKEHILYLLEAYGNTMIQLFSGAWSLSRIYTKESTLISFMNNKLLLKPICDITDQIKNKNHILKCLLLFCYNSYDINKSKIYTLEHIRNMIADYIIPIIDPYRLSNPNIITAFSLRSPI